ncbi:hypothetical protein [Pseudoclavibacter terrae]|uniref:hypothetical protein n=1 Tax=Pseudoclavibacter terrae TaxID=1530195 RepID=UPI00232ABA2E|nr:hypothetical protein [Pseudoclavibacter terrae]
MRTRRLVAGMTALLVGLVLTGCATTTPTAVANHEAKLEYHADTGAELLGDSLVEGLAGVENFSATAYTHGKASTGATLSTQHETTVVGASYVTKESTAEPGTSIDEVHMAGSGFTYYLFGSAYTTVVATPWARLPMGDLDRANDPQRTCILGTVIFMCNLVEAWQLSKESNGEELPEKLEVSADGSKHFTSAVTFDSLEEAGLYTLGDDLRSQLSEDELGTLLPLHVWVGTDGIVQKIEVNGTMDAASLDVEVQFGFEITGTPTADDLPDDPASLAPQYVTNVTADQASAFWDAIGNARTG